MDNREEVKRTVTLYGLQTDTDRAASRDPVAIVAWGAVGVGILALCWVAYVGATALGQLAAR